MLRPRNRLPAEDGIDVIVQVDGPPLDQPTPHTLGHGFLLVVLQAGDALFPPVRAAHGYLLPRPLRHRHQPVTQTGGRQAATAAQQPVPLLPGKVLSLAQTCSAARQQVDQQDVPYAQRRPIAQHLRGNNYQPLQALVDAVEGQVGYTQSGPHLPTLWSLPLARAAASQHRPQRLARYAGPVSLPPLRIQVSRHLFSQPGRRRRPPAHVTEVPIHRAVVHHVTQLLDQTPPAVSAVLQQVQHSLADQTWFVGRQAIRRSLPRIEVPPVHQSGTVPRRGVRSPIRFNRPWRHALHRRCIFDLDHPSVHQPGCDGFQPLPVTGAQGHQHLPIHGEPDTAVLAIQLQPKLWHQCPPPEIDGYGGSYATKQPIC